LAHYALFPGGRASLHASVIRKILTDTIEGFLEDEALTRGAAIAFFVVISIAPTLFVAVTIASWVYGQDAAQGAIGYQLRRFMSPDSVDLLEIAIRHAIGVPSSWINNVIGILVLTVTVSGVFGEMEDALNIIWKAPRKGSILLRLARGRALSLLLVIGLGFLLLISMLLSAIVATLAHYIAVRTPYNPWTIAALNAVVSTTLLSAMFAAIYKTVPNRRIAWRDVGLGAICTALLFEIGQVALGVYFAKSNVGTPYGAAGGLIVLMIWAYCAAQVFLLGAEFTKAFAFNSGTWRDAEVTSQSLPAVRG
jgi:membrane protein